MESKVKSYIEHTRGVLGSEKVIFDAYQPSWLIQHGKPTEIMMQKMILAFNNFKGFKATIDSMNDQFMMFETEFKHMSLLEQENYIKEIQNIFHQTFEELRSGKPADTIPDQILSFQYELFRWSSYWLGVIAWRMTGKLPKFNLDLEHLNRFAVSNLTPERAVVYLQKEYERTLTDYRYGTNEFKSYKAELKDLIEDYILLLPKREKSRAEKESKMDGLKLMRNIDLTESETNPEKLSKSEEKKDVMKPYLTSNEAMMLLGIKKTNFWKLIKDKKIESYQVGGRKKLYRTEDLLKEVKKVNKTCF